MDRTKLTIRWIAIAVILAASAAAIARDQLATLIALTPADMKFVADVVQPGLSTSILVGDPAKRGVYAVHSKLPPNFKLAPHSHAEPWRIATVLSGTLYYSAGDTFDVSKLKALGPGSVLVEPRGAAHFAMTKGEAVLLHIVGEGPAGVTAIGK
jgi:quercetin dioxygenase-like cupin family protein